MSTKVNHILSPILQPDSRGQSRLVSSSRVRSANSTNKNDVSAFKQGVGASGLGELLITVLFPWARCWETVFACHKLSETSLCLQSHQQLLLPWGQAIEMICPWLSEWCTLPERTRPAAPSCVCRYVAISSIRLGRVAVGRVCGTFGPALSRAARTTASSPHQRLPLFIWREAARSGIIYLFFR